MMKGRTQRVDDLEVESFLRRLEALEEEPETTIRQELVKRGHGTPSDLWDLIARLAEMNIVIEFTDHLDDATLFQKLLEQIDEPAHIPADAQTVMHIDMSCDDSDSFLRYYADEPLEPLPYDRDRLLPKAEEVRSRS